MKRPVFRRIGDYWFLDVADPFEPLPPQVDEQRVAPYPFDRVLFDGSRLSDSWKVPPPDRSWVTTEDIKEGWPSARRPKQWYPGGGDWPRPTRPSPMRPAEGGIGFWFSMGLGGVAFAVFIVLLVGALS